MLPFTSLWTSISTILIFNLLMLQVTSSRFCLYVSFSFYVVLRFYHTVTLRIYTCILGHTRTRAHMYDDFLSILRHIDAYWCVSAYWRIFTHIDAYWRILTHIEEWQHIPAYYVVEYIATTFENHQGKIPGKMVSSFADIQGPFADIEQIDPTLKFLKCFFSSNKSNHLYYGALLRL